MSSSRLCPSVFKAYHHHKFHLFQTSIQSCPLVITPPLTWWTFSLNFNYRRCWKPSKLVRPWPNRRCWTCWGRPRAIRFNWMAPSFLYISSHTRQYVPTAYLSLGRTRSVGQRPQQIGIALWKSKYWLYASSDIPQAFRPHQNNLSRDLTVGLGSSMALGSCVALHRRCHSCEN